MIKYFKVKGRINRIEFVFLSFILIILEVLVIFSFNVESLQPISTYIIILFYMVQCAKRFHDLNYSGIMGFIWIFVPFLNIIYFLMLYFQKGSDEENKYGKPSTFSFALVIESVNKKKHMEAEKEKFVEYVNVNGAFEYRFDYSLLVSNNNIYEVEETKIFSWLKSDGDWVDEDSPICIIMFKCVNEFQAKTNLLFSSKSGFLQILVLEDNHFNNRDSLYRLYPAGEYINENSPSKESYILSFDKYKYEEFSESYYNKKLRINEWKKEDGEFVKKGEIVFSIIEDIFSKNYETIYYHEAEKDGYIDIVNKSISYLSQNQLIYYINEDDKKRIERRFVNIPLIKIDDFTNNKVVKWEKVGGCKYYEGIVTKSLENDIDFIFTLNNIDNKDYIVFQFFPKDFMLSKGDVISFLFENKQIIDFILCDVSYKSLNSSNKKLYENKLQITYDEIKYLEQLNFLKWKIQLKKQKREIIGGENGVYNYESHNNLVIAIHKFVKEYQELVNSEIKNYIPLTSRDIDFSHDKITEECYVYLMIDIINNHHKIGISNNPYWREKTLQSEKPTIELIASKKFINRKIAASFEKALHETYSDKRIRGEWFRLNDNEIKEVKLTLDN